MMRYIALYIATAAVLLPLDFLFIATVGQSMYKSIADIMAPSPRIFPAVLFYILLVAGIVVFVNGAANMPWQQNLLYGALFGLFCYGTFALTNMALLKSWTWSLVIVDIGWGAIVTAISAALGAIIANAVLAKL